jgi:hypothetical protein
VLGGAGCGVGAGGTTDPGGTQVSTGALTVVGTWTQLTNQPPVGANTVELLTDGTVLIGEGHTTWYKLTPDAFGSYANGTWQQVASSHVSRQWMPSTMLRDGRYLIAGGEWISGTDQATVDIYDPVANTWTAGPDMPSAIGDTAATILSDGRFMCSSFNSPNTYFYDPTTNLWSFAGLIGMDGSGDEKGWTLLQDGTVLDVFYAGSRYDPTSNTWNATGPVPVSLVAGTTFEIGPMSLLYSGKVLQFGGALAPDVGHTVIYDPASNSWTAGADAPDGLQFGDSGAAVLVNGNVLCSTSSIVHIGPSSALWEYNPNVPVGPDTFTKIADGTDAFPNSPSPLEWTFPLQLPNGQVLIAQQTGPFHVYTPAGGPQDSWRPTITSVSAGVGEFTLTGTQLNGLTTGASFGDDANMASNYPIVALSDDAGHLTYARSYNFDRMAPSPGVTSSCRFTVPDALADGSYTLSVSANGVQSANTVPISFSGPRAISLVGGSRQEPGLTALMKVAVAPSAPPGGTVVNLTSTDPSVATVPATVTVPEDTNNVNFHVTSVGWGKTTVKAASANNARYTVTRSFGWMVTGLSGPTTADSSGTSTWTVTLDQTALADGVPVQLQSSNPAAATVPATVIVPLGATSATFPVTAVDPAAGSTTITASLIGSSQSGVFGYSLQGLVGPPTPQFGSTVTFQVLLNGDAPTTGVTINLQSSNPATASVPPTVTVAAGSSSAYFNVTMDPTAPPATITATLGAVSLTDTLGYIITSNSVSPNPVPVNTTSTGTVTLNGPAPSGGLLITLRNPHPTVVSTPASITVPAGSTTATYPVTWVAAGFDIIQARVGTAGAFANVQLHGGS